MRVKTNNNRGPGLEGRPVLAEDWETLPNRALPTRPELTSSQRFDAFRADGLSGEGAAI